MERSRSGRRGFWEAAKRSSRPPFPCRHRELGNHHTSKPHVVDSARYCPVQTASEANRPISTASMPSWRTDRRCREHVSALVGQPFPQARRRLGFRRLGRIDAGRPARAAPDESHARLRAAPIGTPVAVYHVRQAAGPERRLAADFLLLMTAPSCSPHPLCSLRLPPAPSRSPRPPSGVGGCFGGWCSVAEVLPGFGRTRVRVEVVRGFGARKVSSCLIDVGELSAVPSADPGSPPMITMLEESVANARWYLRPG